MTQRPFRDIQSASVPNTDREKIRKFWDPGPKLIRSIRRYQAAEARGGPLARLQKIYWARIHKFWSLVTQCEIHLNMKIGEGLILPHPNGIILRPKGSIGPNCMIFQQVTFANEVHIGGHVDIGAGAKLIGPITVGDHVQIGANAVVTKDVPDDHTAVGVPAKARPNTP